MRGPIRCTTCRSLTEDRALDSDLNCSFCSVQSLEQHSPQDSIGTQEVPQIDIGPGTPLEQCALDTVTQKSTEEALELEATSDHPQ